MKCDYQMRIAICIVVALFVQCLMQSTGVETTNGVTVVVKADKIEGTTAPFAGVYLFDKSYVPCIDQGIGVATVADRYGNFTFDGLGGNGFALTVINRNLNKSAYVCVGCEAFKENKELLFPGELQGSIETAFHGPILVYLQGTGYYTILSAPGNFIIESIPQGNYFLRAAVFSEEKISFKSQAQQVSNALEVEVRSAGVTIAPKISIP